MKYLKSKKIIAGLFICLIISSGLFADSLLSAVVSKMPQIEVKPIKPVPPQAEKPHKPEHEIHNKEQGKGFEKDHDKFHGKDFCDGKFERPIKPKHGKEPWQKDPHLKDGKPHPKRDFHKKPDRRPRPDVHAHDSKKPGPKPPVPKGPEPKHFNEKPLKEK